MRWRNGGGSLRLYLCQMKSADRIQAKSFIHSAPLLSDVLDHLPSQNMSDIGAAIGGVRVRALVDLRLMLAMEFQDHLQTLKGDQPRPDRSDRRRDVNRLIKRAKALRIALHKNMPFLMDEHYQARFFGGKGPEPSHFSADYDRLLSAVIELEEIAECIASVPPIGSGTAKPSLRGFPTDRLENPGTWPPIAFARRIGQVYVEMTGKKPAISRSGKGPFERLIDEIFPAFKSAYEAAGSPFGPVKKPSRAAMEQACRTIQVPKRR